MYRNKHRNQCCGSGSGIRCLIDPWIRDPVWVKNQDPDPGEHPDHISRELRNNFFWVKILKFVDADADPGSGNLFNPGSGTLDKHSGSATLQKI